MLPAGGACAGFLGQRGGAALLGACKSRLRAYGSMTYAAVLSMCSAKLDRGDPRVRQSLEYLNKYWSVEENPGMGNQGLYYFYDIMARALSAAGVDTVGDHNWKKELSAKVMSLQKPDGSWANDFLTRQNAAALREVFDFYGIKFLGHPDMRRLYLRNDFKGYPFRKNWQFDDSYSLEDDVEPDYTLLYKLNADGKLVSGSASGFFISSDGLAVTNYHSIQGASHATVTLSSGECYPVESVVYYAPKLDLAVLRVSRTDVDGHVVPAFSCLELAGTPDVRAGDTVYALGNPLGLGLSVSSGVVSAPSREVSGYALPCVVNTADISKGSSGGALLNVYGHVIGVTSGAFANGNGMYLAVPVDPLMVLNFSDPGMSLAEVARLEKSKN